MKLKLRIKNLYYRFFGKIIFHREMEKRRRINREKKTYVLEQEFRALEEATKQFKYPKNDFNKIMSMILSDLHLFSHVASEYKRDRELLKRITFDGEFYRRLVPEAKSYPAHPGENFINNAIKVNSQSLFVFGTILVNRSLLLLKMYVPDRHNHGGRSMYDGIGHFYPVLSGNTKLSPLLTKFKTRLALKVKWLYAVLRFYRNEFIEHLDRGYQQGMGYGIYTDNFSLSSYKWNYNDNDNAKIEKLKSKLEKNGVHIYGRDDGGRNLNNRYYLQQVFENIIQVPDELLKEALDLIEEVGGDSPQPSRVISEVEEYITGIFQFMTEEIGSSELAKYRRE